MSEFKIEKGIEVPNNGAGRPDKYPWRDMEHGDSILVPLTPSEMHRKTGAYNAASSARHFAKRHRPGWTSVSRRIGDHVRVWLLDTNKNGHGA